MSVEIGTGASRNILKPKVAAHSAVFAAVVGALLVGSLHWASKKDKVDGALPVAMGCMALFVCLFMCSLVLDAGKCSLDGSGSAADSAAGSTADSTTTPVASAALAPEAAQEESDLAWVLISVVATVVSFLVVLYLWWKNWDNSPKYAAWAMMVGLAVVALCMIIFTKTGMSDCDESTAVGAEILAGSASMSGMAGTLSAIAAAAFAWIAYKTKVGTDAGDSVSKYVWATAAFATALAAVTSGVAVDDLEEEEAFNKDMAIATLAMVLCCAVVGPAVGAMAGRNSTDKAGWTKEGKIRAGSVVSAAFAVVAAALAFVHSAEMTKANN